MKCPECKADLTEPGAVTIMETEFYRLEYNPERNGVEMLGVSPESVSTEVRCSNCRVELHNLDLL